MKNSWNFKALAIFNTYYYYPYVLKKLADIESVWNFSTRSTIIFFFFFRVSLSSAIWNTLDNNKEIFYRFHRIATPFSKKCPFRKFFLVRVSNINNFFCEKWCLIFWHSIYFKLIKILIDCLLILSNIFKRF